MSNKPLFVFFWIPVILICICFFVVSFGKKVTRADYARLEKVLQTTGQDVNKKQVENILGRHADSTVEKIVNGRRFQRQRWYGIGGSIIIDFDEHECYYWAFWDETEQPNIFESIWRSLFGVWWSRAGHVPVAVVQVLLDHGEPANIILIDPSESGLKCPRLRLSARI